MFYSKEQLEPIAKEILGNHVKLWCMGRGRDTKYSVIRIAVGSEMNALYDPKDINPETGKTKQKPYKMHERVFQVLGGEDEQWYRTKFAQIKEGMPDQSLWYIPPEYEPTPMKPAVGPDVAKPYRPGGGVAPIFAKQTMATIAPPKNLAEPATGSVDVDMGTVKDKDYGAGIDYGISSRGVQESQAPVAPEEPSVAVPHQTVPVADVAEAISQLASTMVELKKGIDTIVSNTSPANSNKQDKE